LPLHGSTKDNLIVSSQQGLSADGKVWGAAYHIIPEKVKEVQDYLDIREINGYSIQYTNFQPADTKLPNIRCLVYIGMPDNPQFLGALHPHDVATRINQSVGPSGENREYLLQLEEALNSLHHSSGDEHITDLARRVRAMARPDRKAQVPQASTSGLSRTHTEEQEEVEKDHLAWSG
jgi:glutathione-specific gamma-glutamylcyclotransferase